MKTPNEHTAVNPILETAFENHEVRIFGTVENPLFVRSDLQDILEVQNLRIRPVEEQDLVYIKCISGGQTRELVCVNEMGLYELIFRSQTEAAKRFRRWVCEVIREIRLKGYYVRHGLSDIARQIRATRLEIRALEHEEAALLARREKAAVLENVLRGGVPVGALVHDICPRLSQQAQASLCGRIIATALARGLPVGHKRVSHGKVRTMRPADFATVAVSMLLIAHPGVVLESGTASVKPAN